MRLQELLAMVMRALPHSSRTAIPTGTSTTPATEATIAGPRSSCTAGEMISTIGPPTANAIITRSIHHSTSSEARPSPSSRHRCRTGGEPSLHRSNHATRGTAGTASAAANGVANAATPIATAASPGTRLASRYSRALTQELSASPYAGENRWTSAGP
ncbi:hypothetical protein [Nonomuraea recticatena]|uniref:hypothetical protein n=1 Tax=Nonomuraea recticatena TaxID=46178 RepID=UPI003607590B